MECPDCGARVSSGYFDPVCPVCGGVLMILSHPEPTFPELKRVIQMAESFLDPSSPSS